MRSPAVLVLTALLLTSTALVNIAEAGPKGGPGGGGKGPHSAPAPHAAAPARQPRAAAPAPHSGGPRVAAPHGPGPGPRRAAPHAVAPPRIAPPAARQPQRAHVAHRMLPPKSQLQTSPLRAVGRSTPTAGRSATPGVGGAPSKPNRAPTASSTSRAVGTSGEACRCTSKHTARGEFAAINGLKQPLAADPGHGAAPGKVSPIAQPPIAANSNRDRNANRAHEGRNTNAGRR